MGIFCIVRPSEATRTTLHRVAVTPDDVDRNFRQVYALVHHDPTDGFLRWEEAPDPLMLIWSPRIFEFLQVLENTISYSPARGICREVGYGSGHEGALRSLQAMGVESERPIDALLTLPPMLAGAGWGTSEVEYDDATGDITWAFPNGTSVGVAAQRAGPRADPACAFFEGFGAGWVKGSLGLAVEFIETECRGRGDPRCRFASRPLGDAVSP